MTDVTISMTGGGKAPHTVTTKAHTSKRHPLFAVHVPYFTDREATAKRDGWTVTHLTTGLSVGRPFARHGNAKAFAHAAQTMLTVYGDFGSMHTVPDPKPQGYRALGHLWTLFHEAGIIDSHDVAARDDVLALQRKALSKGGNV